MIPVVYREGPQTYKKYWISDQYGLNWPVQIDFCQMLSGTAFFMYPGIEMKYLYHFKTGDPIDNSSFNVARVEFTCNYGSDDYFK
jgi:hypothetical protein